MSSSRRSKHGSGARHGARDKSPAAQQQRRQRAFLVGTLVSLAMAVIVGLLIPVADSKADLTARASRR